MTYREAKKYKPGDVIELRKNGEQVRITNITYSGKQILFEVSSPTDGIIIVDHKRVNQRQLCSSEPFMIPESETPVYNIKPYVNKQKGVKNG